MSDLPIEVALTLEQRIEIIEKDIKEVARGVNVQGSLLQTMVFASDQIVKKYLELTTTPAEKGVKEDDPKGV